MSTLLLSLKTSFYHFTSKQAYYRQEIKVDDLFSLLLSAFPPLNLSTFSATSTPSHSLASQTYRSGKRPSSGSHIHRNKPFHR